MIVAGITVAAVFLWSLGGPASLGMNPSYSTSRELQSADLSALNASATKGQSFAANNTLWFHAGSVDLVFYASPPDHDLAFVIQGMVNPAIHVVAGSRISLTVINMDWDMYHNWALSKSGPPFSSMPMMGGGGMMGGGIMMAMTMLGPASGTGYWSQEMSFTAVPGSYWYLCEYAGHAADGMYGSLVVG